jgi:flagellin
MALTVNTNVTSMAALGHFNRTNNKLEGTFARISSGLRINKAGDDAAGLAVAENLATEQQSLRQAGRNTNDGISVIQTAEGATNEVGDILKRMRELAVQSSSETLANSERAYIQSEFGQLSAEVDRIAAITNFNGVELTNGAQTSIDVQAGIFNTSDDRIAIQLGDLRATSLAVDLANINMSNAQSAQASLTTLDSALDSINSIRSNYGSVQNRLESSLNNLSNYSENLAGAESRIRDADFAHETAQMSKYQTMQQAGVAILGQANQLTQGALRLIG